MDPYEELVEEIILDLAMKGQSTSNEDIKLSILSAIVSLKEVYKINNVQIDTIIRDLFNEIGSE